MKCHLRHTVWSPTKGEASQFDPRWPSECIPPRPTREPYWNWLPPKAPKVVSSRMTCLSSLCLSVLPGSISSWFTHPNTWTIFDTGNISVCFLCITLSSSPSPAIPYSPHDLPTFMPPLIMMTPSSWRFQRRMASPCRWEWNRSARLKLLDLLLRQLQHLRGLASKTRLTQSFAPVRNLWNKGFTMGKLS